MINSADLYAVKKLLLLFLEVIPAIFLIKSFNASSCIDKLLLAGVERMTHRTNFRVNIVNCTSCFKFVSATAADTYIVIFWMYIFLHFITPEH